ncbi:hypothetical protein CSB07_00320 [Candidatus Gracilibacteria bacterium]|nr:MAG: hypothetical protein CSB07_00320 [Candidatus Gracilibacteria bacterium]PIE85132.1 MAG: hypothetical protein CSA08_03745 [Candidatus Gracilibacteria bacterium]
MPKIFGININKLKYKEFFSEITKLEKQKVVFTPNPEMLLESKNDKSFKKKLLLANYLIPDGTGLYIAYQILNEKSKPLSIILIPYYLYNLFFKRKKLYEKYGEKICGSDLTLDLVVFAEKNKIKITVIDLFTGKNDKKTKVQKKFKEIMKKKFPKLELDYFIFNPEKKEQIINKIKKSESKILFSTLGAKKQEKSVIEIMNECKNLKLGLAIGSSFDYFTGFQKRSPLILRKLGLEWFYRLLTGPKKLNRLKRLYNAIFVFLYKVISSK